MTLRAIVFDLWGTLLAERRDLFPVRARLRYEGVAPVLARYDIETTVEEFTARQRDSNRVLARLQEHGRDVSAEERARHVVYQFDPGAADRVTDEDVQRIVEAYGGVILQTMPEPLDGAVRAIEEARERGLGVGLISNTGVAGGRHLRAVLDDLGLLESFDSLVFSDERGRSKPHAAVFDAALEELGVTAAEAVFVGDTPRYDIGPPRRYGWWVVQVGDRDDGDPPAHRRVEGPGDVFEALRALGLVSP